MLKWYIGIFLPLSIIFPLAAAVNARRQLLPAEKMIVLYLLADALASIVSVSLAKSGINNMPVFHAYPLVEFTILTLFFKQDVKNSFISRGAGYFIGGFILFALADAFFIQGIHHFNTYPRTLEALLLVCFSLVFFYRRIDAATMGERNDAPAVWFAAALLLYFSGSLILFVLSARLTANSRANDLAWAIHASLQLLLYVFFTIGFLRCRQRALI